MTMDAGRTNSSTNLSLYDQLYEAEASQGLATAEAEGTKEAKEADPIAQGVALNDGFSVAPSAEIAASNSGNDDATQNDGSWQLPALIGASASPSEMGDKISGMNDISDGALMFHALLEMNRTSQLDMSSAKDLRNAMHDAKINEKENAIEATESKIEAQQAAA